MNTQKIELTYEMIFDFVNHHYNQKQYLNYLAENYKFDKFNFENIQESNVKEKYIQIIKNVMTNFNYHQILNLGDKLDCWDDQSFGELVFLKQIFILQSMLPFTNRDEIYEIYVKRECLFKFTMDTPTHPFQIFLESNVLNKHII